MKGLISMIKGMEKEFITGLAEAIIKGTSFKISGTDMGKCIGITRFTKANGSKENPAGRLFQGVQLMKKAETQKNTQILPAF